MGTLMILLISRLIYTHMNTSHVNYLIWLGRNSLCIMAMHMLFISISSYYIKPLIPVHFAYKAVEQLFVWALCIISAKLINSKAKWMLGKF